ncbi:ATP-dependent DNA helicase [Corynebacterium sp. HMSC056F09]|uniref:DNA 3'-5' helicase n=4 Tax=Corynebacteriaceae TaxID=1653 RepID=A0A2N6TPQ3_9CORY|nr:MULTISPECIES: ATP-dependent DNA helicase UvrD2 [Corynebacterium]MTD92505.1 ATP-dependent DNA helicase UvrD2 [Corynebacterium aurimucosum]OFK66325.1 ATP-dependent DNA helicase [Corynebacterium sp. HMSC074A09]OFN79625.1 ATP-dependent DNA helicase [Corynebacterium sp. HMSC070E08]OFO18459.1 ATP-dependent DNA helicase [Corynebacterium sp. HMSC056F09]OFO96448.1 ATP-dependent DNA helicase [Corynebacterium sp. HMSC034H07]
MMRPDLSLLDEDQRAAATAPRGPVCILAGAGTGKTRTITYRIAHMVDQGFVNPQRVLAVTFTSRAASEMRERLNQMGVGGVQAQTFHAAARRQLKYFWPQVAGDLPWQLIDNKFSLVARAVRSLGLDNNKDTIRDFLGEIEWAKSSLISPEGYPGVIESTDREAPGDPAKVAEVFRRYEDMKATPDLMYLDFDDLLMHIAGAIENVPAVAEVFREQYRTFVVDEYQDVTPLQQRVLEAWLGERDDLTVVGDANQTIYSFNGASPEYLLNFSRTYPQATVVKLQRDYRSTPQVTDLANEVISKATGRAAGTRLELQGMREPGPEPTFKAYESEEIEAKEVAGQVLTLLNQGVKASEIAILYRINAQSEQFEQALADAGVVYQVRGGEGFFRRPEILEAIRVLIAATRRDDLPNDPVAVARAAFVELGLSATEPQGAQARERWQSLTALVDLIAQIVEDHEGIDLPGVLGELHRRSENKHNPTMEGVTLATIHAAKGLEWDAVFLVGLTEKLLPINHAIKAGDEHVEEERRLFYVGITRAREHLALSWALAKTTGSRASRERTRFLDGVVPGIEESQSSNRRYRPRRCRVCSGQLSSPAEKVLGRHEWCEYEGDEDVFNALRAWRASVAKDSQVPAYVVFSDATLQAISEALPASEAELLDISGVGPSKLERYGAEVLQIIASTRG